MCVHNNNIQVLLIMINTLKLLSILQPFFGTTNVYGVSSGCKIEKLSYNHPTTFFKERPVYGALGVVRFKNLSYNL